MMREWVLKAAWSSSMGFSMDKASGVKVLSSGVAFCERDACEIGGRMGLLW